MGRVASADGAQDASEPGVGPAASAWPKRPARDPGKRLPAERPPGRAGCGPLRGACAQGRAELRADPDGAAEKLRQALGLWRGPAALRPRLRAVHADRDRPLGGAALGGIRGARRGRAGARPARGPGLRARGGRGRAAAPRAPARPADARPVPLRPPGGGARGLPQRRAARWSRRSASSRARSSERCTTRSSRRTPLLMLRPARRSSRRHSMAARRCWRAGIGSWPS